MRKQITLSRFLLVCGLAAAISGVGATYLRHRQHNAALVARIQAAGGFVEQEPGLFCLVPISRVVGVDLSSPNQAPDRALLRELPHVESLRRLRLNEWQFETADIVAVAAITSLAELGLCGSDIDDADVARLRALTNLRTLDVSESEVSDQCLEVIQELPNLETLCIAATRVRLEGLSQVRLSKLKIIDASYCDGESLDLTRNGFGGMPNLEALSIRGSTARTIELDPARTLQKLRAIDLRATSLRIEGLARSAPNLRQIGLESRTLTKGALKELERIILLESVDVGTDYRILFLDIAGKYDTASVSINNQVIQVPVALQSEARELLTALVKSRPGLQIAADGQLTGNIYDRRRVYGSGSDGSEKGGLF